MLKLLVIALDGATFGVINPLCDEGKLPNLNKLIATGVHGILESTFPPVTGPAFAALAAGKNPGKTGIFDSFNRVNKDSFEMKLVSSADIRRTRAYWDYLSNAGLRVGVVNYPFLYPPYAINGIMVSGLGSSPEDDISYPKEFKQLLIKKCGTYRIDVPWHYPEYDDNPPLFLKHALELLDINEKTIQLLLEADLQVLTVVISAADFAQHSMWRYIDPSHPFYKKGEADKYGPDFVRVWQRIDEILGTTIGKVPPYTNVLIVSDHGFGPRRGSFYTNSWLEQEGYLFKRHKLVKLHRVQKAAADFLGRVSPYLYRRLIRAVVGLGRMPTAPAMSEIDMKRSLAFSPLNVSLAGEICINHRLLPFRKNHGDFEAIRGEIVAKLEKTCKRSGLELKTYSPQELYTGKYADLAPDILFEIDNFECSIHFGFGQKVYQAPPAEPSHSGIHKKEGILIAHGSDIRQGTEIEGAQICDIAPTILHMSGLPVPGDMDGRVLKEIFKDDSQMAKRSVTYQEVGEERRIRDRISKLKRLGRV